jgi:2-polyprenyl-3-methyl-5-hydroxy-6-metoxy-1,4-benzoquinol methylase
LTDEGYTQSDHRARVRDPYAAAKYRLTIAWLKEAGCIGEEIFNIGCGSGVFTVMAAEAGARVRAFEPDSTAFEMAAASQPPGCTVESLGLSDIPGREIASVIVMHDVLEHIADEDAAVADVHRLLRPDGLLVLSVPAMPSLFGYHDEELGHYRRYTKASLRDALMSRFDIERLRYFGMTFIPVTLWFSRLRRKPYAVGGTQSLLTVFDAACRLEQRISPPVGTSLICLAHPVQDSQGASKRDRADPADR